MEKEFVIISDSLGDTAKQLLRAAMSQFDFEYKPFQIFSTVTTELEVDNIIDLVKEKNCFVVTTVIIPKLQKYIEKKCSENSIEVFDAINPLVNKVGKFMSLDPAQKPGSIHKLDISYFNRVEAIEFAVKYDDGKNIDGIHKADIVILGISRTSKTPLSMYLANLSYKVCNIPIVLDMDLPQEVYEIDPKKIIGLTNDPSVLMSIRQNRLKSMGFSNFSNYSNMDRIQEEISFANRIYSKIGCRVINVANTSIEENASLILRSLGFHR